MKAIHLGVGFIGLILFILITVGVAGPAWIFPMIALSFSSFPFSMLEDRPKKRISKPEDNRITDARDKYAHGIFTLEEFEEQVEYFLSNKPLPVIREYPRDRLPVGATGPAHPPRELEWDEKFLSEFMSGYNLAASKDQLASVTVGIDYLPPAPDWDRINSLLDLKGKDLAKVMGPYNYDKSRQQH